MSGSTKLYRQIHPRFARGNIVLSPAFHPEPGDPCRLSVYDGDQITPEAAWMHYTKQLKSCGVMAVTVSECRSQDMDVVFDGVPYKEHAYVEFGNRTKNEIKTASRHLKRIAQARGWLFLVNENVPNQQ